jgi:hypothetical protein
MDCRAYARRELVADERAEVLNRGHGQDVVEICMVQMLKHRIDVAPERGEIQHHAVFYLPFNFDLDAVGVPVGLAAFPVPRDMVRGVEVRDDADFHREGDGLCNYKHSRCAKQPRRPCHYGSSNIRGASTMHGATAAKGQSPAASGDSYKYTGTASQGAQVVSTR